MASGIKLEKQSAHILLGQCVEYEVGNVFDPAYTVICKIKKSILKQAKIWPFQAK